jgi:hypothetical protein
MSAIRDRVTLPYGAWAHVMSQSTRSVPVAEQRCDGQTLPEVSSGGY